MGKPYFGMTGTALNAWVNVAAITAMTLFGTRLSRRASAQLYSQAAQATTKACSEASSSPTPSSRRWGTQTPTSKAPSYPSTISDGTYRYLALLLALPDAYCTLSFFGAMSTFVIGEPLGRKKTLIIGVIIM